MITSHAAASASTATTASRPSTAEASAGLTRAPVGQRRAPCPVAAPHRASERHAVPRHHERPCRSIR